MDPKMVPKCAQNRLTFLIGTLLAQDGPKMVQDGPRRPQDGPRYPKMAPRCAKMGPRRAQDGPKIRQNGPKIAPRWPSWAVLGSLGPPWAFLECSSCSAKIALQLLLNTFGERPPVRRTALSIRPLPGFSLGAVSGFLCLTCLS